MNVTIPGDYSEDFILELIAKFIRDVQVRVLTTDFRVLTMWIQVEFGLDGVSCEDIILYALKNIDVISELTTYKLEINNTIYYPGTNTRLITLLRTINYGTRHFKGIPIIVDECKLLNNKMDELYNTYSLLGMVF